MKLRYLTLALLCALLPQVVQAEASPLVINRVSTKSKLVALTFDADMTPKMLSDLRHQRVSSWYNADVISVLQATHTPATLFLTGLWVAAYPEVTHELSLNPLFELGNHSYDHSSFRAGCTKLKTIPNSADADEVTKTEALLTEQAAAHQKYFRFPGLCFEPSDATIVHQLGYLSIGGSASGDAFQTRASRITKHALAQAHPGAILVFHMHGGPDAPATAQALPQIIAGLKAEGYQLVKISELLQAGTPTS